ncbi:MAG: biotin/lipoyl-containing protein, partial [Ginsengibacter sp.]
MDIKQIHELVKLVNKSNIGELMIEKEGFKITIKQKKEPAQVFGQPMMQPFQSMQQPAALANADTSAKSSESKHDTAKPDNLLTIKSPMIGTFYRQSGPDKPIFVSVGDEVEVGQVVCIIEAMK